MSAMRHCIYFLFHLITILLKLSKPGGLKTIVAENIMLWQQLITISIKRKRAPNLSSAMRIILGLLTALIKPNRLSRIGILIKPSTLMKCHKALVKRKYHLLYSSKHKKKPRPRGPNQELVNLIIEMKKRNPSFGYRRIAMQIANSFDVAVDKDLVRRVLAKYYQPTNGSDGPSWLTFLGHMKDSLWSIDLFRAESIILKSHWVLVVMDQYTRQIIGFAVHLGNIDGIAICRMFNRIISKKQLPKYLSTDNDPLFTFHRWQTNLRVLDIQEIKSIPKQPRSHPFIERLIGSIRRELLNKILFWTATDLQNKLVEYQAYFNSSRCHWGIGKITPRQKSTENDTKAIKLQNNAWKMHCRGLFQLPLTA